MVTKTYYDDLGRRSYLAENWANFGFDSNGDPIGIGDSTDHSKDRVTAWEYNGLSSVTKLTAYNSDGTTHSPEETEYVYTDAHDASLVRVTKYPDGNTTIGTGEDNVQTSYNLDGTVATRKDQRGVVHTYTYDNARRLALDGATTIPSSVDGTIKSIGRTYNGLGEPLAITSYSTDDGSGTNTTLNQIQYTYTSVRTLDKLQQSHEDPVDGGTPYAHFLVDASQDGNGVLQYGLHRTRTNYPVASGAKLVAFFGSSSTRSCRLGQSAYEKLWGGTNLNGNVARTFRCHFNGVNRLAEVISDDNPTYRPNVTCKMYSTSGNYDSYDRFGRTIKKKWQRHTDGAIFDQFTYTYDYAGNRTAQGWYNSGTGGNQDFTYDGLHRLRKFRKGTSGSSGYVSSVTYQEVYDLDPPGNWDQFKIDIDGNGTFTGQYDLTQNRYFNSANEFYAPGNSITAGGGQLKWANPQQDAAGNTTTVPRPSSLANSDTLTYDAWNRLVEVAAGGSTVVNYEYDGLGQRIVKDVAGGTSDDREYYYNDKWQLLTEVKDASVEAVYQWHPFYVDALATRMRASDTHFFLQDANYNVTAAVDDSTDTVVERYNYTPYGEVTFLDPVWSKYSADA